jgi:purine-binding chemotaxis protein CheW
MSYEHNHWLLCRAQTRRFALPLGSVIETMRPLPVEPVAAAPGFVRGLAIVRGEPVLILDSGLLLGGGPSEAARFVTVRTGERVVGLAVDAVLGVEAIELARADSLPPLLDAFAGDSVAAIASRDAELLLFLRAGRLAPDPIAGAAS